MPSISVEMVLIWNWSNYLYLLEKSYMYFIFRPAKLAFGLQKWGTCHYECTGDCTEGHPHPVLYDIFYIVQYLLDTTDKFIPPVNSTSIITQNSNNQQASLDTNRVLRIKLWCTSTKILIIIKPLLQITLLLYNFDQPMGNFCFKKKVKIEVLFTWPLLF